MKDRELPSATRGGKLIEQHNPQPEVRKNAENAKDWEFQDDAALLYRMAVLFKDRLVDPLYHTCHRSPYNVPVVLILRN